MRRENAETTDVALRRDPATVAVYATDNSVYQVSPHAVAVPTSVEQLQRLVRQNFRSSERKPIVARGGGTGTNGQSLTDGISVDLKRGLHDVIAVDPAAQTAVVQPGVVTDALNAALSEHGLFWAPHTSTTNRATVGGMIATDAAGKGSLRYGRAHRHVVSLDVLLDDGSRWRAEPVTTDEALRRAAGEGRGAEVWKALVELADHMDLIGWSPETNRVPEVARGLSGYGIDRFRTPGGIDPVPLLVGSEGTLAITVEAKVRLEQVPVATNLVVVVYPSFIDALADAVRLRDMGPIAIESFDEHTLAAARSSPAWPVFDDIVEEHTGGVLLLEFEAGEGDEMQLADLVAALDIGPSQGLLTLTDPADCRAAWKVRADAVGLLAAMVSGGPELKARPTAFVEDCAVPVDAMCDFIADFRQLLDSYGLSYGMFGHADVGCVHVRPSLDLADPGHEAMLREVTEAVIQLVARYGGVLWGEHGRGFRGESAETFFDAQTIDVMRRVKSVFDPEDVFNPGKLYRPHNSSLALIPLDGAPLRGVSNRSIPVAAREEFDSAFACNGNGLCFNWDSAAVMCPSYKVTQDPALSPKGRADLIRAWLARGDGNDLELEELMATNFDSCLSCSACSGKCPVQVDIPELKSRFLERFYDRRKRPISHRMLSRFEEVAVAGSRVPIPSGLAPVIRRVGRTLGLVDLPLPAKRTGHGLATFGDVSDPHVVILPDVFSVALESSTLAQAGRVLSALGLRVAVADFVPSGKFDHVKGLRRRFARAAEKQQALIDSIVAVGAIPVTIEPATGLLHQREYPEVLAGYPSDQVRNIAEILVDHLDRLKTLTGEHDPDQQHDQQRDRQRGELVYLPHCTEAATSNGWPLMWEAILAAAGYRVTMGDVGCCGMAGIFGHEAANQELSRALWEASWAPLVDGSIQTVATGYSCRSQGARFADGSSPLTHPLDAIGSAIGVDG